MNYGHISAIRLIVLLLLCWTSTGWALTPKERVELAARETMTALSRQQNELRQQPERLYEFVQAYITPHFDFDRIAQWVLGRHNRTASPTQQQQFRDAFRTFLVRSYASALIEYANGQVNILQVDEQDTRAVVRTELVSPNGNRLRIDYRMIKVSENWMVFDVSVEGISIATSYRNTLDSEVRRIGLDGLIGRLNEASP